MYCIETSGLSHRFSKEQVLYDVALQVPEGSIYGFLGPNGAGKTTTLRLILGLLRKQEGEIRIFGQSFDQHRISILKRTGSLIEAPSVYAQLTAKENLAILQKIYQCPESRIGEVLQMVDLADTGNKKAGKFSLGMKQRLSIAIALLHRPSLLILDEPTNGLDPNGIIEMRELLKQLNKEHGITMVISSHLLTEVEKIATHTGIIHKGRILFQGLLEELHEQRQSRAATVFVTDNTEKTVAIMAANGLLSSVKENSIWIPVTNKEQLSMLNRQLHDQGIAIYQVKTMSNDLESIFIDLVKN